MSTGYTPVELLDKVTVGQPSVIDASAYLVLVQNHLLIKLTAE